MTDSSRRRLPTWILAASVRHANLTIGIWVVAALAATAGVARLEVDTSTDSVLDKADPEWQVYQDSVEAFGSDELIVLAISTLRAFDPLAIEEVSLLSKRIRTLEGVRRVDTVADAYVVRSGQDGLLRLDPLAFGPWESENWARNELGDLLGKDWLASDNLISKNGKVIAVNIVLGNHAVQKLDKLVDRIRALAPPGAWISGVPIFRTEINKRTGSEILLFSGLTVSIIAFVLALGFGSIRAVTCPLIVGGISGWMVLGAMGMAGVSLSLSTMILPSVMLALGCAYSVHVVIAVIWDRKSEIESALEPIVLPVAVSGLTTTIGFLAISATPIEAIRNVAAFGALGTLVAVSAALSLAPALLIHLDVSKRRSQFMKMISGVASDWLMDVSVLGRGKILAVSAILCVIGGYGFSRLSIETDATRWFVRGSDVRESYEAIRRELSGISPMNVVIRADPGRSIAEAEALESIAKLSSYLESLPEVGKVVSITGLLSQMHNVVVGAGVNVIPTDADLVEQYLLLLSGSRNLSDILATDRSAANIMLRVDHNGSRQLLEIANRAEEWWQSSGANGFTVSATGIMYEFARAQEEISYGQVRGLLVALVLIWLLLIATFRSIPIAFGALVPNALPILAAYGLMGLLDVPLDAGTVLVGSIALGIAVDDTVHLVSEFSEGRQRGLSGFDAMGASFRRVLFPLVLTTLAVALGFAMLGFSEFSFTRNLGILTAGIMVMCLVADSFLLPSLLLGRGGAETARAVAKRLRR